MRHADAVAMLAPGDLHTPDPTVWADLGCGDGTFTVALADLLVDGSIIHAVDRDPAALARLPRRHEGVVIERHQADFVAGAWPPGRLDGVLMANSLHFVPDPVVFLQSCTPHLAHGGRLLIVEYDMSARNPWIPYPVSRDLLGRSAAAAGFSTVKELGRRPSRYQRASLYAALVGR
jgi:SAM-dependent methyltransferase